MNQLVRLTGSIVPAAIAAAGDRAGVRFNAFFTANVRNPHTRRAYAQAAREFLAWCEDHRVPSIMDVQPVHVAALHRASHARTLCAHGQAAARRSPPFVRLACGRSRRKDEQDAAALTR